MTTTNKNRDYYHKVLMTPCYLTRKRLEEDYERITKYGINTPDFLVMIADHLTAYNEMALEPIFFGMNFFKPTN